MADQFESFLGAALAPPTREPDRRFVGQVQARIALESRLEAERRSIVRRFGVELVGIIAVAAGLAWLGTAAPAAEIATESPWLLLTGLLAIFGLIVVALSVHGPSAQTPASTNPSVSTS